MSHRGVGDGSLPPLPRHLDPRARRHRSRGGGGGGQVL